MMHGPLLYVSHSLTVEWGNILPLVSQIVTVNVSSTRNWKRDRLRRAVLLKTCTICKHYLHNLTHVKRKRVTSVLFLLFHVDEASKTRGIVTNTRNQWWKFFILVQGPCHFQAVGQERCFCVSSECRCGDSTCVTAVCGAGAVPPRRIQGTLPDQVCGRQLQLPGLATSPWHFSQVFYLCISGERGKNPGISASAWYLQAICTAGTERFWGLVPSTPYENIYLRRWNCISLTAPRPWV